MSKYIQRLDSLAIKSTAIAGSNEPDISASLPVLAKDQFAEIAKKILGKDAGGQLCCITDYPSTSCYRYARGETPPPLDFLLRVLRSDAGEQFLCALMGKEQWWIEMQRAAEVGRKVLEITKS